MLSINVMNIKHTLLVACIFASAQALAQNYFFPNASGSNWATTPPSELGFCPERIDSLYQFLGTRQTKSFILLQDGKIVLEKYFGTYTQDSFHYWASAGKSLTAFLVGQAIDEGLVALNDKTSEHLGVGWTTAPPEKEDLITVRHQLTMTTGLDDDVPDDNCQTPDCLQYKADAGNRWAYHNAPYLLLHNVVANASGLTFQQFTKTRLFNKIGMQGLWYNYTMYGRARDMARFGLLMLANGTWNGDTLLHDINYLHDMTTPSQTLNKSYGYLWWLNGQPNFMVPNVQFVFTGPLIPNAPADMYAALGKNDQKIHVVPSKGWVIVRQGESGSSSPVPIEFDNQMWALLNTLDYDPTGQNEPLANNATVTASPTISAQGWQISSDYAIQAASLYNTSGRRLSALQFGDGTKTFHLPAHRLPAGIYHVVVIGKDGKHNTLTIVKE